MSEIRASSLPKLAECPTGRDWRIHSRRLERERDEARAQRDGAREVAKFWQEQYAAVHPSHAWIKLPWEKKQ